MSTPFSRKSFLAALLGVAGGLAALPRRLFTSRPDASASSPIAVRPEPRSVPRRDVA
jgi:hypothetical protein